LHIAQINGLFPIIDYSSVDAYSLHNQQYTKLYIESPDHIMFMPGRNIQQELAEKQAHYRRLEGLVEELIPSQMQAECTISIQEMQCGDPSCSPIDTVITLLFERYAMS
jgi:hypothetical protein